MFPAVLRVESNGARAFALRVPTVRPTALVALHEPERVPDLALLQHAANIAALEVERISTERERVAGIEEGVAAGSTRSCTYPVE